MMRRIWVAALAVAMVATTLPTSLFAEETRTQADNNQLARIADGMKASRSVTVSLTRAVPEPVRLQQGQPQTSGEPFFKTKNGKITIGVAVLAVAIGGGYMLTRGPDPRQWP